MQFVFNAQLIIMLKRKSAPNIIRNNSNYRSEGDLQKKKCKKLMKETQEDQRRWENMPISQQGQYCENMYSTQVLYRSNAILNILYRKNNFITKQILSSQSNSKQKELMLEASTTAMLRKTHLCIGTKPQFKPLGRQRRPRNKPIELQLSYFKSSSKQNLRKIQFQQMIL